MLVEVNLKDGIRAADLLKRPEMTYDHIQHD